MSGLLWLWFRPRPERIVPEREAETAIRPTPEAVPTTFPPLAPPTADEARQLLDRVFGRTLVMDRGRDPALAVGDWTGDGSADLAVAARARPEALGEINGPFPKWIARDPRATPAPGAPPTAVRIEATDRLLAIVHGFEAEGWRSPLAQQAFLLKNASGTEMKRVPLSAALSASGLKVTEVRAGDALVESLDGRSGYLLWTGAGYVWKELPQGADALRVAP